MPDPMNAISALEGALSVEPSAAGFYELGALKLAAGDSGGAVEAYRSCLSCGGGDASLFNNLGVALLHARRFPEAIVALQSALGLAPDYERAAVNLGKALCEAGRPAEAVARLEHALAAKPGYVPALINLGDALAATGAAAAAEEVLLQAVALSPTLPEAHMTLGIVQLQARRLAAAIDTLRRAVALDPTHADAHANLGHALFAAGDWAAAWPHFEHRFGRRTRAAQLWTPAGVCRWDGTVTPDLQLWLIGEQGLGDQLQFARFAAVLSAQGIRCVIACDRRLVALLSRADAGATAVVAFGTRVETTAARWYPLMSVPAWHMTPPHAVPKPEGYLTADPVRVAAWRTRLGARDRFRVALAWAGNPAMETGRYVGRSPPPASLEPLLQVAGIEFISVQKRSDGLLTDSALGPRVRQLAELDAGADAFLDTAAVLQCVDLLITSDTAIAHLGGALGVPTWTCLMRDPDWRWMLEGAATPWYRSMRLFRQPAPGDWTAVYQQVARALMEIAAA